MVEIDTLFQTKTAKKKIPFGAAHTYIAFIRDYPRNEKCVVRLKGLHVYMLLFFCVAFLAW